MANGNMSKNEIREVSTIEDSYLVPIPCRILKDLKEVHINPDDSISVNKDTPRFLMDSNSETPDKYPNAPQTSPIDLQSMPDTSVFNTELLRCLKNLPLILLTSEEHTHDGSIEILESQNEDPTRNYVEASTTNTAPKLRLRACKDFEDLSDQSCVLNTTNLDILDSLIDDNKNKPTGIYSMDTNTLKEKLNFLKIDSDGEFTAEFYHRSTLSDMESMVVNYGSDVSDISLENIEYESSDENSSCASRDRIEFEALAIDTINNPALVRRFHHCRTRGRNKRALSLDEIIPSKQLHTTDFSKTEFELTF